jgi:hypothetical protein
MLTPEHTSLLARQDNQVPDFTETPFNAPQSGI